MYRARSARAASKMGNASSTRAFSFAVSPSGSRFVRMTVRLDPPAELRNLVACVRGAVRERIGAPERLVDLACPEQGLDELGFEGEVELGRRHERGCALQEARRRPVVLAERRSLAAGGQAAPRLRGQRVVEGQSELGTVARRLLEVVAENLVQLDELGAVLLQPGCEALVQLGAGRFR